MKVNYKYYKGTKATFQIWMNGLKTSSPPKYTEIFNSVVYIHPNIGEDVSSEEPGYIYARGVFFSSSSTGASVMSVINGRVYINGLDSAEATKYYKILNATDIDKNDLDSDSIVTKGYMDAVNSFEAIN